MKIMLYSGIFIIVGNVMINISDFESVVISFLGIITAYSLINYEKEKKND